MIQLKNVTKVYKTKKGQETKALVNISLQMPESGLVCLLGKSGCGKSTLLNILGLLDKPTDGEVLFYDENIYKYNEKNITSYRSQKIGFIFQEFNLFEELNVYDNIGIALDLIGEKKQHDNILEILKSVRLENYEKRNINELSGGEKQRIAIARALIKNPSIILADEPTGNLDSENGRIVFEILKEASKKCLVVLVTHDQESALKYADRIIKISDGKIIRDDIEINKKKQNSEKKLKKGRVSLGKCFKFALGMLRYKKIRLILTSFIISIAFALLGLFINLINFNIPSMHAKTMVKEKENKIIVQKEVSENYSLINPNRFFNSNNLNEINKLINANYHKYSFLQINNNLFDFKNSVLGNFAEHFNKNYFENAYYQTLNYVGYHTYFITMDEKNLQNLDLIGEIPHKEYEILIPEVLADFMVVHGFLEPIYNEKYKVYFGEEVIVNNILELINKKIYIDGENYLIIKGIIKDKNLEKYVSIKNENYDKLKHSPTKLYKEFNNYYSSLLYTIVVNNNFFELSKFADNEYFNAAVFPNIFNYQGLELYDLYNISINSTVKEYKNAKLIKEYSLKEDEIYLSKEIINKLFHREFNNKLEEATKKAYDNYEKKVKERQKLIEEYEKLCLEEGFCDYQIPDVEMVDGVKIENDIYDEIVREKGLIGSKIKFIIKDPHHYIDENQEKEYELKIVGFGDTAFINYQTFSKYMLPNESIEHLEFYEYDLKKLENIFQTFSDKSIAYKVTTKFSNTINDINAIVKSLEKISLYITGVFLVFAIILFTLFITASTQQNKKKIGILRAIGLKVSDVIKIFVLESLIINLITFILSNGLTIIAINILNIFITKEINFYIEAIVFKPQTIMFIVIVEILVTIISLVLPIIILSKNKPHELINNK